MIIFWTTFILSWSAYAAFMGLTGYLVFRAIGLRLIPYVAGSGLIAVSTMAVLVDQQLWQNSGVGRWTYGLNMTVLILLMASWLTSRSLTGRLSRYASAISGAALLAAILWSVGGPGGFFLPLLFFPEADLFFAHLIFVLFFLTITVAIFLALNRLPVEEVAPLQIKPKASSALRRIIASGRFWLRASLALLALFWLAQWSAHKPNGGLVNYWGEPGMSPAVLQDTEILCTGHFSRNWQPFRWCWNVELKSEAAGFSTGRTIKARRKILPFIVDNYWQGSGPKEIDIALFEPSESYWGDTWLLPSKENLLVALKKDSTGSGAYQLVNQVNSWLMVNAAAAKISGPSSPEEVIKMSALDYLESYAAGHENEPMVKLSAPLAIDSISGIGGTYEISNISMAKQALATVKNFRMNDEKTLAILTQLLGTPESPSRTQNVKVGSLIMTTTTTPVQSEAFAALAKINPVLGWKIGFDLYEAKVMEAYSFSTVIPQVINPQYLSQIDPAQIRQLLNGEPRLAREIARAFCQMSNHRTKDTSAVPWLGECLGNADVEVQYFGMLGLYEVCGKKEKFPTALIAKFKTDPQKYLTAYQIWWDEHKAEYVPPAP